MDLLQQCIVAARRGGGTLVLPEGDDDRVVRAAARLAGESIARPVLLGKRSVVDDVARNAAVSLEGVDVVDPRTSEKIEDYARAYSAARPKASPAAAARQLRKPLFFGGMMVACGDAHAMLAGVANPTQRVVKAASLTVGTAPGVKTPSSYFVMVLPHGRTVVYADCAFNIDPDEEALADIALASAASAERILREPPHVAFLTGSSMSDRIGPASEKARLAAAIAGRRAPGIEIASVPGEDAMQSANVLIFPDLTAGNIGYKLTQYLAGARAIGPFLQGFARPVSDLSRGASVDDIVSCAAVLLCGVSPSAR